MITGDLVRHERLKVCATARKEGHNDTITHHGDNADTIAHHGDNDDTIAHHGDNANHIKDVQESTPTHTVF